MVAAARGFLGGFGGLSRDAWFLIAAGAAVGVLGGLSGVSLWIFMNRAGYDPVFIGLVAFGEPLLQKLHARQRIPSGRSTRALATGPQRPDDLEGIREVPEYRILRNDSSAQTIECRVGMDRRFQGPSEPVPLQ